MRWAQLELSLAEELEQALEAAETDARQNLLDAVAHARKELLDKHRDEMAQAAAALEEEVRPGMSAGELERRHAECRDTLRLLRGVAEGGDGGGGGWKLLSGRDSTRTFVRRGADGMVWAKATGEVGGSGSAKTSSSVACAFANSPCAKGANGIFLMQSIEKGPTGRPRSAASAERGCAVRGRDSGDGS